MSDRSDLRRSHRIERAKLGREFSLSLGKNLAHPERFERPTLRFVVSGKLSDIQRLGFLSWKRLSGPTAPAARADRRSDSNARCRPATCRLSNMSQRGCEVSDRC